jgi:hypothetical protein
VKTELYSFGPVKLVAVQTTTGYSSTWTASAQLDATATLEPIPFTIRISERSRSTTSGLLVFGSRGWSTSVVGTAHGVLDPVSGGPIGASTIDVATRATGGSPPDLAAVRAADAKKVEKELREQLGSIAAALRAVETSARSGRCTRLFVSDTDRGPLGRGEVSQRSASMSTAAGAPVPGTTWTLAAATGSIAPATAQGDGVRFTLTGGQADPTAVVHLRAVSPAGISEETITFKPSLPRRLRVTVTAHQVATPPLQGGPQTTDWHGTMELTLAGTGTVGGETVATYTLDFFQIASGTYVDVEPNCTSTVTFAGGRIDPSATVLADLELHVPATGAMRYEIFGGWSGDSTQVDVGAGEFPCMNQTTFPVGFPGLVSSGSPDPIRPLPSLPLTDHAEWVTNVLGLVTTTTYDFTIEPLP